MQETQETQVQSLGVEDPLEEGMATHSCSGLENPMDRCMHLIKKKNDDKNAKSTDSRGPVNPR